MSTSWAWLATLGLLIAISIGPAGAHQDENHDSTALGTPRSAEEGAVQVTLRDPALVDQSGQPLRFASDAIGERIVVVEFIYTNCSTVCPLLTQILVRAQAQLPPSLVQDVRFISVSVDPARDTPKRLRQYAAKFGIKSGWTLLTGQKRSVDEVLKGLSAFTPDFVDHSSMVLVGDAQHDRWTRFFGFPDPDQIAARIEDLAAARDSSKNQLGSGD